MDLFKNMTLKYISPDRLIYKKISYLEFLYI